MIQFEDLNLEFKKL